MAISALSNRFNYRISHDDFCDILPCDLLSKIFDFLPGNLGQQGLASARLVNRHWKLAVDRSLTHACLREDFPLVKLLGFKFLQHIECYCEPPDGDLNKDNLWGSSGTHFKNRHLVDLSQFQCLRYLRLEGHRVLTNESLVIIGRLTQLITLHLHCCPKLNGKGLRHLANLHHLEFFAWTGGLMQKMVEEDDLKPLARLARLKALEISPIECHQLKLLVELFGSKVYRISALKIVGAKAFSHLSQLPNLQQLQLEHTSLPEGEFGKLSLLTGLNSLDLSSLDVQRVGKKALASLPHLANLRINDIGNGEFLNVMTQLTALTGGFSIPVSNSFRSLFSLKNLISLNLTLAPLTERCNWASLSQLKTLTAHFAIFSTQGAESIQTMTNFVSLDLSHALFPTGFDFGFFANLTRLKNLRCNSINTLDALGFLKSPLPHVENSLPKLEYLGLRCSDMVANHHQLIAKLPNLIELDLTGIAYSHLFESYFKLINPELKVYPSEATQLNFEGCFINETTLSYLSSLQNLKEVDLAGAFFEAKDYVALRTQRPDLKIYPREIIDAIEQAIQSLD